MNHPNTHTGISHRYHINNRTRSWRAV